MSIVGPPAELPLFGLFSLYFFSFATDPFPGARVLISFIFYVKDHIKVRLDGFLFLVEFIVFEETR